jgi:peptidyl-prolyl cis-trans isomerase D
LLPVEDGELQAYYDEHADEFLQGEQANARHILIRLAPDASEEDRVDAELHAGGVAKIARTGADFAELVAIHSEDPGTKDSGGDLGWFGRGRMVKEFEDAVFSAKPGDILGPVKSQFGYHIIKVEGFRPAHQQPLEEVKEQVRARVLEGRASAEAEARATALAKRLQTEQPTTDEGWSAIADEDEAVSLNRSLPFENGMPIAGASEDGTLATAAFDAEEGEIRGPLTVRRGLIVWQVAEVVPAGIPPFEEVRAAVEQELRRERALELAAIDAEELAAAWRDGSEPAELADRYDADVTPASAHRRGASIGTLGPLPAVDREVFAAEAGAVITPQIASDRGVVVVRVNSVERVGTEEIAQQLEMLRSQLMAERAAQLIRSMVDERRRDTPITMDNELMQRFAPRAS